MRSGGAVWVLGEVNEQRAISRTSLELLGIARQLADTASEQLSALFIGSNIQEAAEHSTHFGSDRTYVIDAPDFSDYDPDLYTHVVEQLCREGKPSTLLAGHTALSQDLFPRLAARLESEVVTDCVGLAFDHESEMLLMTKPVFGGNALAVFTCNSRPQIATVRARVGKVPQCAADKKGEIIRVETSADLPSARTRVIRKAREETDGVKLEDAEVVVSGGRGLGGAEGFGHLRALARLLGGAVGASRPPCDLGWISSSCQVGLTGQIVAPNLYLAVAISGAMQHLTGMSESKYIVAVNKDASANIFKFSDYGIVGDYKEILPAFIEKLQELLGCARGNKH